LLWGFNVNHPANLAEKPLTSPPAYQKGNNQNRTA
jgi:hypothetical protein